MIKVMDQMELFLEKILCQSFFWALLNSFDELMVMAMAKYNVCAMRSEPGNGTQGLRQ